MSSTRMIICEAAADDSVNEIVNLLQEHVRDVPGMIGHSILVEDGGLMVVLITDWPNRQDCLAYHASRAYRQLVAATQHLQVGNYVVKLFQNKTELRNVTGISGTS
jgi:quinol monooxygenase YgiN